MEQCIAFSANFLRISSSTALGIWNGFNAMASNNKNIRLGKRIATHNGMFHCDEALACFMLKQLPEYANAEIVRTRDPKVLDECDIVIDVGATYDPKKNRFDHHQRSFEDTLNSVRPDLTKNKFNKIKLSSAGLVYAHFGLEVISSILNQEKLLATSDCLRALYLHVYEGFVEELDAIDNGIPMYAGGEPIYRINTHLSARVHRLNSVWNDPNPEDDDLLFQKAVELTGFEFKQQIIDGFSIWWPAREIIKRIIAKRKEFYKTGEIILLDERCSWKDHLYAVEEEMDIAGEIKFCIFHDRTGDTWRVQAIPVQPGSFICRVFLHKDWRGVRDQELSDVTGIKDSIFCHVTGFIGGNKTKAGALEMAIKSLNAAQVDKE